MEDDDVVKAPVTRLRRRLSVESDVSSPVAPSTPTKKRLAAKPQLDNIDELASVSSPRGKRRTSSFRGTTDVPEDMPATPARRSTRIKSNTSITSEVAQAFDSPRARRAARRTSFAGSDTDAPNTPTRKTRARTRKDSASSIENQEPEMAKPAIQTTISEEPEAPKISSNNSPATSDSISPNSVRKSQRIAAKRASRTSLNKSDSESNTSLNKSRNKSEKSKAKLNTSSPKPVERGPPTQSPKHAEIKKGHEDDKTSALSQTTNLINELKNNKSAENSMIENNTTPERKSRKTSLNKISEPLLENSNDQIKLIETTNSSVMKVSNNVGGGDGFVLISEKENTVNIFNNSKRKKRESEGSKIDKTENNANEIKIGDKIDGIDTIDTAATIRSANASESDNFLQQTEVDNVKCRVYIEDSDSNTGSLGKSNDLKSSDADDQCVPVIEKIDQSNEKKGEKIGLIIEDRMPNDVLQDDKPSLFTSKPLNSSVEPMDIDETIPVNVSILNSSPDNKLANQSAGKKTDLFSPNPKKSVAVFSNSANNGDQSKCLNKSILSNTPEKTTIANKSTLILSQLRDDSASDANVTKSPKKTDQLPTKANEIKLKRSSISITEESNTPLKNKRLQKTGMQTSTPVILSNSDKTESNNSNIAISKNTSKTSNKNRDKTNSSDESTMEEMSQDKSGILDDEAEDAGDDYESGDSQDESQRRYEEENEIVHKGETLTSEEEFTDDSDYEKDSFIVSSNEEDEALLSGSGDDLSDGDNELNMTAKSKKKYNERKDKEQKKASREMYEARHGKNKSLPISSEEEETSKPKNNNRQRINSSTAGSDDDSSMKVRKNNRRRIDSTLLGSEDDSIIKPRKNNRLRLDSSKDVSVNSDTNKSISENQNLKYTVTNENEITIVGNESVLQKKDPLKTAVKAEPMTPQKGFDISTVKFSAVMDVEQVQLNENTSILRANETSDPLQATIDNDDGDSDSSSENEEIMQNYDSMLSDLKKEPAYKAAKDISLNLNKKSKEKTNPIIDQLNLTQTKSSKKSAKSIESLKKIKENSANKANESKIKGDDDESSSDAIDMKLLFPDDTSESSDDKKNSVPQNCNPGDEDFIPLKRSEGKTNLRESFGDRKLGPESLILKASETKKNMSESSEVYTEDTNASVHNASHSKKKKKRNSESLAVETAQEKLVIFEEPEKKAEKKKKEKKERYSLNLDLEVPIETPMNESATNKKKKKKLSQSLIIADSTETEVPSTLSLQITKKNKKLSISLPVDEVDSSEAPASSKKKNRKLSEPSEPSKDTLTTETFEDRDIEAKTSKKRKRNSSVEEETVLDSLLDNPHDLLLTGGNRKKKRKISKNSAEEQNYLQEAEIIHKSNSSSENIKPKKIKKSAENELEEDVMPGVTNIPKQSKKRKQRGEDEKSKLPKAIKDTFLENITVPRLPTTILDQLDEKSSKQETTKNDKLISTSAFQVVETRPRKNKPSQYLEDSIYLNSESPEKKRRKNNIEKPKVLPFVPTASTSGSGFTTNFKVNVNPKATTFIAQASNMGNFKKDYLLNKKIKQLGSFEIHKKQRAAKLRKF